MLLEPIYEEFFLDFSYGFRPNKRAVDCAADVANTAYKHRHVIDADIEAFFDSVVHRKLIGMLGEQIVDPRILELISQYLRAGFQELGKPWEETTIGAPQGGPLSPLLASLHTLPEAKISPSTTTGALAETRQARLVDMFRIKASPRDPRSCAT